MLAEWQAIELNKAGKAGGESVEKSYAEIAEFEVFFGGGGEFFLIFHFFALAFAFFFLYGVGCFNRNPCMMFFVRGGLCERRNIRQCFYRTYTRHALLHTGVQLVVPLYQEKTQ